MNTPIRTVSASTYDVLKHDIIFGLLPPGRKLKLGELRAAYGASVSILRETLSRLASDGFVQAREQRGFFVAPVSAGDLVEIAELRVLLEASAIAAALTHGDADWEAGLVAAHHKLSLMERAMADGTGDKEAWKRADWGFHHAMIGGCRSRQLLDLHGTVFDKYLRYQMLVLTNRGETAMREHRDLLHAALARDIPRAQDLLRTHVEGGVAHTLPALASATGNVEGRDHG